MADEEYNRKMESLQQYIPFLKNMIVQLKDPRKKNREQQLTKMISLHSMITDKKKKLKLETLIKCEDVILKLYSKVITFGDYQKSSPPVLPGPPLKVSPSIESPPITPSSPSPPRDIPMTKPVVIPTEKVVTNRDSQLCPPPDTSTYKTKIDVYSSAADSLKIPKSPVKPLLSQRAAISKPPISLEDLEALQADCESMVDPERMSLGELTDLRDQLQKQLSTDTNNDNSGKTTTMKSINTTVRNSTILTKKAVECSKGKTDCVDKKTTVKNPVAPVKSVKVIKEPDSIFGSALSSIDSKIMETAGKQKERRNSSASVNKDSKEEKKGDMSSHKSAKEKKGDVKTKDTDKGKGKTSDKSEKRPKDKSSESHSTDKTTKDNKDKSVDKTTKVTSEDKIEKKSDTDATKTSPQKELKTPEDKPTYKRLADKYNPKPRKLSVEIVAVDVPKDVTNTIEQNMKTSNAPLPIPFLDNNSTANRCTISPTKTLPPPPPINTTNLLSPTSSTNSMDNEISTIMSQRKIPPHVSNILSNPSTTDLINMVVNQFKGKQTPNLLQQQQSMPTNFAQGRQTPNLLQQQQQPMPTNFPSSVLPQQAMSSNFGAPVIPPKQQQNFGPMYSGSEVGFNNFWPHQQQQQQHQQPQNPVVPNFQKRSFTPIPNQFDQQQCQMDYFPPRSSTPNPYHHQQQQQFDRRGFGNNSKDTDMRYENDWRRDSSYQQWAPKNQDPRLSHRDPRNYNANRHDGPSSSSYRRDSREFDRYHYERDNRPRLRDPRVNRFQSNRYDRGRSQSRSRDIDNDTFASPLNSLYGDGGGKTGKGYGVQNYKMQKSQKADDNVENETKTLDDAVQEDSNKEEVVEENVEKDSEQTEENTANVSSSTEMDLLETTKSEAGVAAATTATSVGEITSSTSDGGVDVKETKKETDGADIINDFLKKLLNDEQTRVAASQFIDTVSSSLNDDRLKMIIQTVKQNDVVEEKKEIVPEEEEEDEDEVPEQKPKTSVGAKKKPVRRNLRRRRKIAIITDDDDEDDEDVEEEEEEKVVVSVGERIKNRKRTNVVESPPAVKKKRIKHRTELDLLHEDIQDMFIRDGVLTATGKRMCCLLKNDENKTSPTASSSNETTPITTTTRGRRTRSTSEKFDAKSNLDKLKIMSNVRVLIPKISMDNLTEDGKRYSLRCLNKSNKSYVENESDDEQNKNDTKQEETETKVEVKEEKPVVEKKEEKELPKRLTHRKRTSAWASGIIKKRQKIKEKFDVDDDKTFDLIEPDKNYYTTKPWHFKMHCKLCEFDGKNIARHYRTKHSDSEVLSSRLSPQIAAVAIKESIERKLDDPTIDLNLSATAKIEFKCRFCELDMNTKPSAFYDHISTHTGEYRYVCDICQWGACYAKAISCHYAKVHRKERENKCPSVKSQILGYLCLECNFVQMNRKTVENHINIYHLGEGKKMMRVSLSSIVQVNKDLDRSIDSSSVGGGGVDTQSDNEGVDYDGVDADDEEMMKDVKDFDLVKPEIVAKKAIDMTVFTCNTNIQEENEKIEQERLKKMAELNDCVKTSRQSLNFTEQLRNRLLQQEQEEIPNTNSVLAQIEPVIIKTEPVDIKVDVEEDEEDKKPPPILIESKKPSMILEEPPNSVEVVQKENIFMKGMIAKLQGILKEDANVIVPPLTPLTKQPLVEQNLLLSSGFLNIAKNDDILTYICKVPSCLFTSDDRIVFLNHWQEDHDRINQTYKQIKCRICSTDIEANSDRSLLKTFFIHVEDEHLEKKSGLILRTRRLSGDKLSMATTTKDDDDDNSIDAVVDIEEDNPFPFKISEVKSLANEDLPPLSPIKEKVVAKTPSPKFESLVLKELKQTSAERQVAWKCAEAMKKFLQCPRELYKCPQFFCKFATNFRHFFENHIKAHAAVADEMVSCVYCDVKTPLSHSGLHIDIRHSNCLYSCSQCLYRAINREYVMVHMKLSHKNSENPTIVSLPPKTARTIMMTKAKQYSVKEACQPYICGVQGCKRDYLFEDEFVVHLHSHHGLLICGYSNKKFECAYKCIVPSNMIEHWRTHNTSNFHCLICKFGCMEFYTMLAHYSNMHANMELMVVDRRQRPTTETHFGFTEHAFTNVRHVNQEILDSVNSQQVKVIAADTTTTQVATPVVTTTTVSSDVAMQQPSFVFASSDVNSKDSSNPAPGLAPAISDPLSLDTIDVVSDSDVNLVTTPGYDSDSQDVEMVDVGGMMKKSGLIGYQLYRCAHCDISFSNGKDFKSHCTHSKRCLETIGGDGVVPTVKPFRCVHCKRCFKNAHSLTEHLRYHGQLRFQCSLCVKKFPSTFTIKVHMRVKHNVTNTVTTPLISNKTNLDLDEFVLRPKPVNDDDVGGSSLSQLMNFQKSPLLFLPSEIDKLPQRHIFTSNIQCALCPYSTKVRTNLVRHLQFHIAEKSVPEIAPVNPVPCLDKNEKMFDKMTNLAISSFTGTGGRMGGQVVKSKQIDMKVEDVESDGQIPAYIPANRRYACGAHGCNYLCPEEGNLRHHLLALHDDQTAPLVCRHCKQTLETSDFDMFLKHLKLHDLHLYKCSYCLFVHNLKHKVEKHCTDKHPDKQLKTITIRAMETEIINVEQIMKKTPTKVTIDVNSVDPSPVTIKWTKPWHCGMCKYRCAAKNEIIQHISNKHDINTQYKCTLCTYKTDDQMTFDDHFKHQHPDNDIDIINVYRKCEGGAAAATATTDDATNNIKDKTMMELQQFDTTPLWQRDRPRVRHIRGILFEDTSPQKGGKKSSSLATSLKSGNLPVASTSSSSSNLDLAIEAVATGQDEKANDEVFKRLNEQIKDAVQDSIILIEDEDVAVTDDQSKCLSEDYLLEKYGGLCQASEISSAFLCPICKTFHTKNIEHFVYHVLSDLKIVRYQCKLCTFKCLTFDVMLPHCQAEHGKSPVDNAIDLPMEKSIEYWLELLIRHQIRCMFEFDKNLTKAIVGEERQSAVLKSQCEHCQLWFVDEETLQIHELDHWSEGRFACGHCTNQYVVMQNLFKHHLNMHPGKEFVLMKIGPQVQRVIGTLKTPPMGLGVQYKCVLCGLNFNAIDAIQKHHDDVHSGENFKMKITTAPKTVYCCSYCHEKGEEEVLRQHHGEQHQGVEFKMYQCICLECSLTFFSLPELREHYVQDHESKPVLYCWIDSVLSNLKDSYCCVKCPYYSGNLTRLRAHVKRHLRPIECLICGARFVTPHKCREHQVKEHGVDSREQIEENKDRLKEYDETVKGIIATFEKSKLQQQLQKVVGPKKMLARKSTGAPFIREKKNVP